MLNMVELYTVTEGTELMEKLEEMEGNFYTAEKDGQVISGILGKERHGEGEYRTFLKTLNETYLVDIKKIEPTDVDDKKQMYDEYLTLMEKKNKIMDELHEELKKASPSDREDFLWRELRECRKEVEELENKMIKGELNE